MASIINTHKLGFPPKKSIKIEVKNNVNESMAIAYKSVMKLDWDVVFLSEAIIEAKRYEKGIFQDIYTELIIINFENGFINLKCKSLNKTFFDFNDNISKRLDAFKRQYEYMESNLDIQSVLEYQKEFQNKFFFQDYTPPAIFPVPPKVINENFQHEFLRWTSVSFLFGLMMAICELIGLYKFLVFEGLLAFLVYTITTRVFKIDNFIKQGFHDKFLILFFITTYIAKHIFQYFIVTYNVSELANVTIIEYFSYRISIGLKFFQFDLKNAWLISFWVLQVVLSYTFTHYFLLKYIYPFMIKQVSEEILRHCQYCLSKGMSMEELRNELNRIGWKSVRNQNQVFDAISALIFVNEVNRNK